MPNYNSPRPRRANRNDGYLSKILFWQQELDAYTLTGCSRYPLSRIEDSLAYFKERRAAYLRSLEYTAPENLHCDGEDLPGSQDIVRAKLSAGTHNALMEWAKSVGLPTHPQN